MNIFFLVCLFFSSLFTKIFAVDSFEELFKKEPFQKAHLGYFFLDLDTKKVLYALNEDQFFIPASLQKIPLSMASIHFLGKDFYFKTDLAYDGFLDGKGTLQGNLWIIGGGDPSLSLDIIPTWESLLKSKNISKISGKIFVDTSAFETAMASPYWFFEDLGNYFGVGASALSINKNFYEITFQRGEKIGDPAKVLSTSPSIPDLVVFNEVLTGPAGSGDLVYIFGSEYSPIQFYRGTVPLDANTWTVKGAIPDPPLLCGKLLAQKIFPEGGVEVLRTSRQKKAFTHLLLRKQSPSLEVLIDEMNHESIDLYAETLLKTIGEGFSKKGLQKISSFLKDFKISSVITDGAGTARNSFFTPRGFTQLLLEIDKNPSYTCIKNSFPSIGEGTLESFPPLQNALLKAKTGSFSSVYNLGGYLILPSGKKIAFCVFFNNCEASRKELREWMSQFLNLFIEKKLNQ